MRPSRAIAVVLFGATCALPAAADETSSGHQYGPTAPGWGTPNPGYPAGGWVPGNGFGGAVRPLPPGQATCRGYCDYVKHNGVDVIKIDGGQTVGTFLQSVGNRLEAASLDDTHKKIDVTYTFTTYGEFIDSKFDDSHDVNLKFPFLVRNTETGAYKINEGAAGVVVESIYPALNDTQFVKMHGGNMHIYTNCEKTGENADVSHYLITYTIGVGNYPIDRPRKTYC